MSRGRSKGGDGEQDIFLEDKIERKLVSYEEKMELYKQGNVSLNDQFNRLTTPIDLVSINLQDPSNIEKILETYEDKRLDSILANSKQLIEDFEPYNVRELSGGPKELVQSLTS